MDFRLKRGQRCEIRIDGRETEAVKIAAVNLAGDLERALGVTATVIQDADKGHEREDTAQILAGTLGVSDVIKSFVEPADPDGETLRGHKEAYLHRICNGKLIIAGNGRRGTIYGIYDFCEALGVSPWHFWADVPVREKQEFALEESYRKTDYPSVEYRGIFINDEEELEAWVQNYMKEPTIGVKTYEKVFELLLRLKANYIWPAMHVNSFNLTPENGALAERMGIVVGTSHCDMLMRSNNREWNPWIQKKGYTEAVYDYSIAGRNREILQEYWRESVEQNRGFEVCYTLGMRGIHDSGFETKGLQGKTEDEIRAAKVELLEKIIGDQREILKSTLGHETMMTFIPYKEVLDLYDHGLEIPEDMTLVWANDNYGYIRRYPSETEKGRSGGNGIYYHNSYWAAPSMSYVFLCSIPLAHTGNELRKAWEQGIRKLWVLNSGAMKPLEQEITFFLRLAWEIGKPDESTRDVEAYVADWIDRTFTGGIGGRTAALLNDFSQLSNVRKVENMDCDIFSQTAYGDEAAVRIHRYEELFERGNRLYEKLPEEEKAAFFQMVLMRIHAAYFTYLAYYYGDRSTLMYERGNMQAAAFYSEKSKKAEDARSRLLQYYNREMFGGKWNGILNPEGFPPPRAAMMPVQTPPLQISGVPSMRLDVWNEDKELCFRTPGEKWIEVGNRGTGEFTIRLQAPEWVELSERQAVVRTEKRILVRVPDVSEDREGEIRVEAVFPENTGSSLQCIPVRTEKTEWLGEDCALEEDGLVVLEGEKAANACRRNHGQLSGDFRLVRRLGRMQGNLVEACVQREAEYLLEDAPEAEPLQYWFATQSQGEFLLEIHRFPSLNSVGRIRVGISLDGGGMQIVESFSNDEWRGNWTKNVLNNVDRLYLKLPVQRAGKHRLSVWAVDRYFAFTRMVIYTKPRRENNLGGIRGEQALPAEWDISAWCDAFYGTYRLPPRPVFYVVPGKNGSRSAMTCQAIQAERFGKTVTPDWYLERGKHIFEETAGGIRIDAAAVLAQSGFAWMENAEEISEAGTIGRAWRHCCSESFGRSGLAMYIRMPLTGRAQEEVPVLNYRIRCKGGNYTVWMLSKFGFIEESNYGMGVDDHSIPRENLYGNGSVWSYESEQIYRWVPAARVSLGEGEHVFRLFALASGMRYDRFYLTRGEELPPTDTEWMERQEYLYE